MMEQCIRDMLAYMNRLSNPPTWSGSGTDLAECMRALEYYEPESVYGLEQRVCDEISFHILEIRNIFWYERGTQEKRDVSEALNSLFEYAEYELPFQCPPNSPHEISADTDLTVLNPRGQIRRLCSKFYSRRFYSLGYKAYPPGNGGCDDFNARFTPNHTKGKGEPDPHANYRVNPYSYLAIDDVTGGYEYSKKIPQGFHITQHEKLPDFRIFKVVKDGVDTYDIVYVGTMMVQNGFAYIAGETLFIEEPYYYLKQVRFPPFAVSYPLEHPAGMTQKDFEAQVLEEHRDKLKKSIKDNEDNDTSKSGIFYFDLTKDHVLYPPHPICTTCQAELLLDYEYTSCPNCDGPEGGQVVHKTMEQVEAVREIKNLEARLNEKETENKNILEAKLEIETIKSELREALIKVGCMIEEVEKSNRNAVRLAEQLQAVQADHAVMEAELRELRPLITLVGSLTLLYADLDGDILKKRRRMSECEDADKVCAEKVGVLAKKPQKKEERIDAKL
ncbi:hypothetical protein OROMI_004970 [Orobanche minor]